MRFKLLCAFVIGLAGVAGAQNPTARDLHLRGDRFKPLTYEQMTPEQKTLTDHVLAGDRGSMGGPVQHAGLGRQHTYREWHELGFTGSVSSQYEDVGGDACTISDGVLLKRA